MILSKSQLGLHWRLWKRVKAALMQTASPARTRETWTKHEEDQRRHALYIQALGEEKSLTEIDNDDFDKVKAAMLAIIEPGNLPAQLAALNGQQKRLLHGIRQLGFAPEYVQAIVDTMDRHGRIELGPLTDAEKADRPEDWEWQEELARDDRPQRRLEDLHPNELKKIIIALQEHERRIRKAILGKVILLRIAKMTGFLLPLRSHKPSVVSDPLPF